MSVNWKLHCEKYGPRGVVTFRKHLSWYFKGLPHIKDIRQKLHTIENKEVMEEMLSHLLQESSPL